MSNSHFGQKAPSFLSGPMSRKQIWRTRTPPPTHNTCVLKASQTQNKALQPQRLNTAILVAVIIVFAVLSASFAAGGTPAARVSPSSLAFGSQPVGTTSTVHTVSLSNVGIATLDIASLALTGTNAGDFGQTNTCGKSLAVGARCTISVTFTPSASGSRTASLSITDNARVSPQTVSLSGTGAGPVDGLSPASLAFGSQPVGTASAAQTVNLSNTGNAALNIASLALSGTNASDFAQSSNCGSSVAAGAHCAISVTFTPAASGSRTASLSITDNASGSPQTVSLSGTGTVAVVSLSPSSLAFANQSVGTPSAAQTLTLSNTGNAPLSITSFAVTGTNASDFSQANTCGSSVAAGSNCAISVTFTPAAIGSRTASLSITDNASGSPQTVSLSGSGLVNPPTLSGISPTSGPTAGGTAVTLAGTGFLAGATITFGGAAATAVTVVSPTQITATTPADSAGAVNVVVTNPNGLSGTLTTGFTFTAPDPGLCGPALVLPQGNPTVPYYATLTCSGGTPPYTWSLLSGTLPSGLTFNPSTGLISGTPSEATEASFTAQVTDSSTPTPQTAQVNVTLNIVAPAESDPELPLVFIDTTFPNTSGYITTTVCPSSCNYSTLQAALNDVHNQGGDVNGEIIELASGATFTENDTLPAFTMASGKWIILTTNTAASNLPGVGIRMNPSIYSPVLAKIASDNSAPAIQTANNANHYWFWGLEMLEGPDVTVNYGLFVVGNGDTSTGTVPDSIVIDRCYLHPNGTSQINSRAVTPNGTNIAVINSYLSGWASVGFDAQAIAAWNSPGPIKIANNFLEGGAEITIFGGADPTIPNLVNSDIEIRQNHYFRPLSWNPNDPSYAGTHWEIKDTFELKNAQRVLVEGNIFENNWADAQVGFFSDLTPRNQNGGCSWCTVQNVTIRYNVWQHSANGFDISGADSASPCGDGGGPSLPATHILIANNLLCDISNSAEWGGGEAGIPLEILNGSDSCTASQTPPLGYIAVTHVTEVSSGSQSAAMFGDNYTDNPMANTAFENSIFFDGTYGWFGSDVGEGNPALADYFASPVWTGIVEVGGTASYYSNFSGNWFPSSYSSVGFVDQTNCTGGTWSVTACALQSTSPYHAAATDGLDVGADIGAVNAATYGVQ